MLNTEKNSSHPGNKQQFQHLLIWTALIGCYIIVEWIFNQHLLSVMSLEDIIPKDFGKTVLIGKILLSLGLNLIIRGLYQYKQYWKFVVGFIATFIISTALYMEAVESFPPELRYASHYGSIHRKDMINLKDKEQLLAINKEDGWYVKPILLTHFLFTLDNKNWLEFQNKITEPLTREVNAFVKNKNKNFENYQKSEEARKELDSSWQTVVEAKAKYEAVRYSKAKRPARKAALDEFRAKTGIEPSTTQEEFYKDNNKDYNRALAVQIFGGYADANIAPIYIRDIPQNLDQTGFLNYIDAKAKELKGNITPSMKEIRNARKSPEIVNTFALPPIMMAMSLLSIMLNVLILAAMWVRFLGKIAKIDNQVIMPIFFALTFFFVAIGIVVQPLVTIKYSYWNNAEESLSVKYPGWAAFWKVGLKLEPIVCITKEEPGIASALTKALYKQKEPAK